MADDIIFNLDGDASSALNALEGILAAIEEISAALDTLAAKLGILDEIGQAMAAMEEAAATGAQSATELANAEAAVATETATVNEQVTALDQGLQGLNTGLADAVSGMQQLSPATAEEALQLSAFQTNLDDLENALPTASNDFAQLAQNAQAMVDPIVNAGAGFVMLGESIAATQDVLQQNAVALIQAASAAIEAQNAETGLLTAAQSVAQGMQNFDYAIQASNDDLNNLIPTLDEFAASKANFDQLAQSAQSLAPALGQAAQDTQNLASAVTGASSSIQNVSETMAQIAASMGQDDYVFTQASDALAQLGAGATQAAPEVEQIAQAADTINQALIPFAGEATSAGDAATTMGADMNTANSEMLLLPETAASLNATFAESTNIFDQIRNAFANLGGAAQNAGTQFDAEGNIIGQVVGEHQNLSTAATETATAETATADAATAHADATNVDMYSLQMLAQILIQVSGAFLQEGMAAQDAMAHVTGLADQSLSLAQNQGVLDQYTRQLEADSIAYGISMTDATNGLYYIISAGFSASDSMKILDVSMKAASATGASMTTISNGLTSILKAYGAGADQAAQYTNQMITAVVDGKQTFQEFANVIGPLAATAARTGFSFDQVTAAEATMTQINPRVRQDAQNLQHLMETLTDKVDKTAAAAKSLGIGFDETHYKSLDLIDRLKYLAQIAGGDTTPAFAKLLTDITSTRAAFMVLSGAGSNYTKIQHDILTNTQALSIAFQQSESTMSAAINHITAGISVLAYQFVVLATPLVAPVLEAISSAIQFLTQHVDILIPVLVGLTTLIGGILIGVLVMLAGMFMGMIAPIIAIVGPLALFAAGLAAIIGPAIAFFQNNLAMLGVTKDLVAALQTVGTYLAGTFTVAVRDVGAAFRQTGNWIQANFGTALMMIYSNIIPLFTAGVNQIIPAMQRFGAVLSPIVAYLVGPFAVGFRNAVSSALQLAVVISGNIVPIFNTFVQILKAVSVVFLIFASMFAAIGISSFAEFLSALLPVIGALLTGLLPALVSVVVAVAGAVGAFLAANAVIIAIGIAIAGAVVGFIGLVQSSAPLREILQAVWMTFTQLWQVLVAQIGPIIQQVQATVNTQLVPAWQHLMTSLQPLMPTIQLLGGILAGVLVTALVLLISVLAGVIAGLGQFIQGLIQVIGGIVQFVSGVIQLFTGLFTVIQGLVTGNSQTVQQGFRTMWQGVQDIWQGACNILAGVLRATLITIVAAIGQFVMTIINFFKNLSVTLVGHSIWPDMWTAMIASFTLFVTQIITAVTAFVTQIITAFTAFAARMQALFVALWNALVVLVTSFVTRVIAAITTFVAQIITIITTFGAQMQQIFTALWAAIQVIWQTVLAALLALLQGNFAQFVALITQAGQQMQAAMQTAWNAIVAAFNSGVSQAVSVVNGFVSTLAGIFANLASQARQWGVDFMNGLIGGITSMIGSLTSAVGQVASTIAGALHHSKPDYGPLANDDQWMPDFGDTLANGLNAQIGKVASAAQNVAGAIALSAPGPASFATSTTSSGSSEHVQVLKEILAVLKSQRQGGKPGTTTGYGIPSTELGSINQQFNQTNNKFSVNDIANIYNQINTLGGLSNEYGGRGAPNGVGF